MWEVFQSLRSMINPGCACQLDTDLSVTGCTCPVETVLSLQLLLSARDISVQFASCQSHLAAQVASTLPLADLHTNASVFPAHVHYASHTTFYVRLKLSTPVFSQRRDYIVT